MEQLIEKKMLPTVSLATAAVYLSELEEHSDELSLEVAARIRGRISVARLSGQSRVDLELAIVDSIEVDTSIDSLINNVIDLR